MNICIFGDSIAKGHNDDEKNGWVNRLSLGFSNLKISNFSISGDATKDLIERFDEDTKKEKYDLIIFAIGTNDSVWIQEERHNYVPLNEFEKNLNFLISKSKKIGSDIVCIGLTRTNEELTRPIPWRIKFHYINECVEKYNQTIKNICQKKNVYFVDMIDLLEKSDLPDGLHPNAIGHEKMYERIKDFLIDKKLINKI